MRPQVPGRYARAVLVQMAMRGVRSARTRTPWLVATLGLVLACKNDKPADEPKERPPAASRRTAPEDSRVAPVALGPVVLSEALPAVVAGVAILRLPHGMASASGLLDPLAPAGKDATALTREIDEYLARRFGVRIGNAHTVSLFAIPAPLRFGVIVEGAQGVPTSGEGRLETHGGVAIYDVDAPDWVMAAAGGDFVFGHVEAVRAALDAQAEVRPRLRDAGGVVADMLRTYGDGASLLAVADVTAIDLAPLDPVRDAGVERAAVALVGSRLVAAIRGEPADLEALALDLRAGFDAGAQALADRHADAVSDDETMNVIGVLIAQHNLRRLQTQLEPKLDEGALELSLDLQAEDGFALVHLTGIVSAVAVPALTAYLRRAKTTQVQGDLRMIFDGASAYFDEKHIVIEVVPGGGTIKNHVHVCPGGGPTSGEAGITPPLSVDCNDGPGGRCVPGSSGPGGYPAAAWDDLVWKGLGFSLGDPHYFHYNFRYDNDPRGYGSCRFTAQAFADLDDDGVFSTYELVGAADATGVDASAGITIHQELE